MYANLELSEVVQVGKPTCIENHVKSGHFKDAPVVVEGWNVYRKETKRMTSRELCPESIGRYKTGRGRK